MFTIGDCKTQKRRHVSETTVSFATVVKLKIVWLQKKLLAKVRLGFLFNPFEEMCFFFFYFSMFIWNNPVIDSVNWRFGQTIRKRVLNKCVYLMIKHIKKRETKAWPFDEDRIKVCFHFIDWWSYHQHSILIINGKIERKTMARNFTRISLDF